jgi:hypothetical protein
MVFRIIMWLALAIINIIALVVNFRKEGHGHTISFHGLTKTGKVLLAMLIPFSILVVYYQIEDFREGEKAIADYMSLVKTTQKEHEKDSIQRILDKHELIDSINNGLRPFHLFISKNGEKFFVRNEYHITNNTSYNGIKQRIVTQKDLQRFAHYAPNRNQFLRVSAESTDRETAVYAHQIFDELKKMGYSKLDYETTGDDNWYELAGGPMFDTVICRDYDGAKVLWVYAASNINQ